MTVNALNLRGTSASPLSDDVKTVDLMAHVDDLQHVVSELFTSGSAKLRPPAVIAHSFGGLVTMKALEDAQFREQVSAVALLYSVPPSCSRESQPMRSCVGSCCLMIAFQIS